MTSEIDERVAYYLVGFADGEGNFNISFRRRSDYSAPWKISLCFNVSQRDPTVLHLFQSTLGCGTMRQRKDGAWYFEVNKLQDNVKYVIPFFNRFQFLSLKKQRDFAKFAELAKLILAGVHLTSDGVREILSIRREMNDGGKRKFSDVQILDEIENPQRPYARLTTL